ncbi:MAG: APC family permease [Chlorobiaceae bacterium]|nr:APC family permease [Chlorobiaceae bacterium]NTW09737.1 APC family permease [Chlorobiaceae bacterium]
MTLKQQLGKLKKFLVGGSRDFRDSRIFHAISLTAFLAWVGLGSDGLSSSCYGPAEAFKALQGHPTLGIFVAVATGLTILVIASSYSHIIELFPSGGGGYLVASKLLSPEIGVVSGSALLIDYILTITISVASGADAIFSFLPQFMLPYKIWFAVAGVLILLILNLRGIKEAVLPLVPVFLLFVLTHLVAIAFAAGSHLMNIGAVYHETGAELNRSINSLGLFGVLLLILKAYSLGAGTFTGIEAVSNGLPVLREPKIHTAKVTMRYMAWSLSITVMGLMAAYILLGVQDTPGKTLNAVLFESITASWGDITGVSFVWITLLSEAVLLFIAAQTGFLDGPRVLANMALDNWLPKKFAMLSDRLVTERGILVMGLASLAMMIASNGSVDFLIVLYSINVFITFTLSQLGMVRHWWQERKTENKWLGKITINGIGLLLTTFILISVLVLKFNEGGWITMLITGSLVLFALYIKRHYNKTYETLKRLDIIVEAAVMSGTDIADKEHHMPEYDPKGKTAAILVNGFNGLGLHTLFSIHRLFGGLYRNFVFVEIGAIDAGSFKGADEIGHLGEHVRSESDKYVSYMNDHGYYAEAFTSLGTDIVEEINRLVPEITEKFPEVVFFGGQLVFSNESLLDRILHNYTVFSVQQNLYLRGIPFLIMPIRV